MGAQIWWWKFHISTGTSSSFCHASNALDSVWDCVPFIVEVDHSQNELCERGLCDEECAPALWNHLGPITRGTTLKHCERPEGPAAGCISVSVWGRAGRTEGTLKPIDLNTFEP